MCQVTLRAIASMLVKYYVLFTCEILTDFALMLIFLVTYLQIEEIPHSSLDVRVVLVEEDLLD